MMRRLSALAACLAVCVAAHAHASTFILRTATDTVSVETVVNRPDRAEGEMVFRLAGLRMRYTMEMAGPLSFRVLDATVWRATDDTSAQPMQHTTFRRNGDSVYVTSSTGSPQRIYSPVDAIPYINPSMALLERIVERAFQTADSVAFVPVLITGGGENARVRVTRIASDSARVLLGSVPVDVHVEAGRITRGSVTAQGLILERFEDTPAAAMRVARPDYSVPRTGPYTAEDVRIATPDSFALAGTLTLPRARTRARPAAVPCVILITGSGPQERDESIPMVRGYRPFRQIADACARAGIATLRIDDRGFGESGGIFAGSTSEDFARDVRAAIAWARARRGIDARRIALLGHSEGGLIAPMIAADDTMLRAIVLMAGTGWTGDRIIAEQNAWALDHDGHTYTAAQRDSALGAARAQMDSAAAHDAWIGFFARHDPLPTARRVHTPVLVLQGATDRQVSAGQAEELGAAFRAGGNRDVTVRVLPDVNHLFLRDANGDPGGYARLASSDIAPEILRIITEWLRVRLR